MRCRGGRFPHRCAVSDRPLPGNPLQRVESPIQHVGFLLLAHALDRFMQVAVMGHFVSLIEDAAHQIGIPLRRVTRAEKCRAQFVQGSIARIRGMSVTGPYAWCDTTESRRQFSGLIASTADSASMPNPDTAAARGPAGHWMGSAGRVAS